MLQAKAFHSNPDILPSLVEFNTYFINESSTLPVLSISGDQLTQLLNGNASLRPKGTIEYFNANKVRTAIATGEFNEHGQDSWVHPQRSIDLITRDEMGHNYAVKENYLPYPSVMNFNVLYYAPPAMIIIRALIHLRTCVIYGLKTWQKYRA